MNIILLGTMGSGRETVTKHLINKYHYKEYKIGTYITKIADMLNYQGLDSKLIYQSFAEECRKIFGDYVWNYTLVKLIQQNEDLYLGYGEIPPSTVISDGKKIADLVYWRDRGFISIGVITDDHLRRQRLIERDEEDPYRYFNHIIEEEARMCALQCDFQIYNNESISDLEEEVDKIILKIKG